MNLVKTTKASIEDLQRELSKLPQLELNTEHYFSNGMYCRKMRLPANVLIVGKVHKEDHFFICASGDMIVKSEEGDFELHSGDVICSKAGTKRAILTLTECIGINVHKTDKTDLEEIEKELIEEDESAMFDSYNHLKAPLIEGVASCLSEQ